MAAPMPRMRQKRQSHFRIPVERYRWLTIQAWKWMHWMALRAYTPRVIPPNPTPPMLTDAHISYRIYKTNPAPGPRAFTPRLPLQFQENSGVRQAYCLTCRSKLLHSRFLKGFAKVRSPLKNAAQAALATTQYFFCQSWGRQWPNLAWVKKTASAIGLRR